MLVCEIMLDYRSGGMKNRVGIFASILVFISLCRRNFGVYVTCQAHPVPKRQFVCKGWRAERNFEVLRISTVNHNSFTNYYWIRKSFMWGMYHMYISIVASRWARDFSKTLARHTWPPPLFLRIVNLIQLHVKII